MKIIKKAFKWVIIALIFFHLARTILSVLYLFFVFPFLPQTGLIFASGVFATAALTLACLWIREHYYSPIQFKIGWEVNSLFKKAIFLFISYLLAVFVCGVLIFLINVTLSSSPAILGLTWFLAASTIALSLLLARKVFSKN